MSLLDDCDFPAPGTPVTLAVSGGPDSLGLLLLAQDAGLRVTVHHVDHHARATSTDDAHFVAQVARRGGVECIVHDVPVSTGANFEARARAARRRALPKGTLTGHTMDDVAETVLLNMLRGAGLEGLSPMVGDVTKPLRGLRRRTLHDFVAASGLVARVDETNASPLFRRNRVRHDLVPVMNDVAGRDVVPLLVRQAGVLFDVGVWLEDVAGADHEVSLGEADCRVLSTWPRARLTRWLRLRLATATSEGETYPPSLEEIERVLRVVRGEVSACELSGGRRLSRRAQRLTLD